MIDVATSPEQSLISAILREGAMALAIEKGIDQRHFISKLQEWNFLEDYYARYRSTPSRLVFRKSFPDFTIKPTTDVAFFCDELKRHYTRRLLTASMKDVADLITDGSIDTAIERMKEGVVLVAAEAMPGEDGDIFTKHDDILEEIESRRKRYESTGMSGVPTGIPIVDDYTGGMGPNEHWIVAARQGNGKSWLLQYIATQATMAGSNILFAALEQTRAQVSMRVYAMMSAMIGKNVFRSENLMRGRDYDHKAFANFLREMKSEQIKRGFGQLVVTDAQTAKITPLYISAQIDKYEPDAVFIDYIQMMNQNKGMGPAGLAQVTEEITKLTNQKGIPIVSASQLNRDAANAQKLGGKAGEAGTENLSGSDQLGNDATVVLTLKRESASVAYLKNVKNRYGVGGWGTYLDFRPDAGIMEQISEDRALDLIDNDAYTQKLRAVQPKALRITPAMENVRARKLKKMSDRTVGR